MSLNVKYAVYAKPFVIKCSDATYKHTIKNIHLDHSKNHSADKLRGGYYTPTKIVDWLCKWAIRSTTDRVLEPSCGDGIFLSAVLDRFVALGARPSSRMLKNLLGIEIIPEEAERARQRLFDQFGSNAKNVVQTGDFFDMWQQSHKQTFDVVVGNPPFIRYQNFPEPYRSRAMDIMMELGLKPNRLTNIWVPFVVASIASLRPGGRLALVLPAELLQVSYATQLRSFLIDHFKRINIVACNELFFDNAEQEVVLLLADGAISVPSNKTGCRVMVTEADTVNKIVRYSPNTILAKTPSKIIRHDSEKWLKYFLTSEEISLMRKLREAPEITNLSTHASVDVGVVTGRNSFFVLNGKDLAELGLLEYVVPLVSRSEQLRGARLSSEDWKSLAAQNKRVHLLHLSHFNGKPLKGSLKRYIRMGEEEDVHKGYKCSIRTPWYAVPSVWEPHAFLFRQIYDFPRAVLNDAGVTSTDTIHRLHCKSNPEQVITNTYTYLTAASAEIEGRSYGGGVLELEPTEAERLLVPKHLTSVPSIDECDSLIRSGCLEDLLHENSRLILMDVLGLSKDDCVMLRNIWIKMRNRRTSRRRRPMSA